MLQVQKDSVGKIHLKRDNHRKWQLQFVVVKRQKANVNLMVQVELSVVSVNILQIKNTLLATQTDHHRGKIKNQFRATFTLLPIRWATIMTRVSPRPP